MSNQINDGGPAFPAVYYSEPIGSIGPQLVVKGGASLRDYFAAAALQGLLGKLPLVDQTGEFGVKVADKIAYNNDVAESCYSFADAMIKAREVKP